ncbi:MAG: site-specific DNA-methyltransferase [Tannerellaceae bacterium]|nr:site-specific DNA-methyltransferase [Tannerellaceae bacterium]
MELLDREDLIKIIHRIATGGVAVMFNGKRSAMEIQKKVRPRAVRVRNELSFGNQEEKADNILLEGENLQGMVTLYKFRNRIDLILTDPPYNTGKSFRYNDKWDEDPNDPNLGNIVPLEDGSRHTKWMKAMLPRLQMMRAMLKPAGILAICIDDSELYHLGMMLDEIFGEDNRIAIINWQKSYAPKNQEKHVSSATEYVLVYAKDKALTNTAILPRDAAMDQRYSNPDNDKCDWKGADTTANEYRKTTVFGIQSPFTGLLHYPETVYEFDGNTTNPRKHWACMSKSEIKKELEKLPIKYIEKDLGDGRGRALVIKGSCIQLSNYNPNSDPVVIAARASVSEYCNHNVYPRFFFSSDKQKRFGYGRPFYKIYIDEVKVGKVPLTYWADEDYETTLEIGVQSWNHPESGHSQTGVTELDDIVGKNHGFQTVKPLRLFEKIIQLWCPPNGYILDPYAGSGTTAHAVLELNYLTDTNRKFILIEQGAPERGDKYARTLTQTRIQRAITGERVDKNGKTSILSQPLGGGFTFQTLTNMVDSKTILAMQRDEMVDLIIATHWDTGKRNTVNLIRIEDEKLLYCVGKNLNNEGYFIIWDPSGSFGKLDYSTYNKIIQEAKRAKLKSPYHVYARYEAYQDEKNILFYKIPDKVLMHLGLNENSDRFNENTEGES